MDKEQVRDETLYLSEDEINEMEIFGADGSQWLSGQALSEKLGIGNYTPVTIVDYRYGLDKWDNKVLSCDIEDSNGDEFKVDFKMTAQKAIARALCGWADGSPMKVSEFSAIVGQNIKIGAKIGPNGKAFVDAISADDKPVALGSPQTKRNPRRA